MVVAEALEADYEGRVSRSPEDELLTLERAGLLRHEPDPEGPALIDVCSNDYLGLAREAVSRETLARAAAQTLPLGAGASRLIYGTHPTHRALERELAEWLGFEACLLFSSGYAANVGAIQGLVGPDDAVFSDALNHASIIDGCRLSRARVDVFPHTDLAALDALLSRSSSDRKLVVVESYYSMDGHVADLKQLFTICRRHGALLMVDEAHALGVFGPTGAGLSAREGVTPDVLVGTLGKALGSHGALICTSSAVRTLLWNRARSLVFSTATSPLLAALSLAQLQRTRDADNSRQRLADHAVRFRELLAAQAVALDADSVGPIVPLLTGDNGSALRAAARLAESGYRAQAIRPPTVPRGTARLRITLSATLESVEVERLAMAVVAALRPGSEDR